MAQARGSSDRPRGHQLGGVIKRLFFRTYLLGLLFRFCTGLVLWMSSAAVDTLMHMGCDCCDCGKAVDKLECTGLIREAISHD